MLTHSYITEVKNEWRYTSTPPICLHGVDRDNFTFTAYSIAADYTGKHNFVTLKLICVSHVFFHAEFRYVIRTALSPTVFVTEFFKMQF
jgi:hypothetical protein